MNKTFTLIIVTFLSTLTLKAQFSWRNDTPSYPAGSPLPATFTYSNVNGSNPPSVTIAPTSGSTLVWQSGYPQIPASNDSRLGLGVNFPTNGNVPSTSFVTLTFTFSSPVCGLTFNLYDIDRGSASTTPTGSYAYEDQVVINSTDMAGAAITTPTITPSTYATVSGNTITGNSPDPSTTGGSKTKISYPTGTCVKTLTITYQTGANAQTNPSTQLISIGDMNWSSALPVILTSFSSQAIAKGIKLNWETSSEINSDRFDLQRSNDAQSFENIGQITAAFETTEKQQYQFKDAAPFEGWNYYRLKSIDRDGTFSYSRIIATFYEQNETYFDVAQISSEGTVLVKTNLKEPIFEVFDIQGKSILTHRHSTDNGHYQLQTTNRNTIGIVKAIGSDGLTFTKKILLIGD